MGAESNSDLDTVRTRVTSGRPLNNANLQLLLSAEVRWIYRGLAAKDVSMDAESDGDSDASRTKVTSDLPANNPRLPLLLSAELRWVYYGLVAFATLVWVLLVTQGIYKYRLWVRSNDAPYPDIESKYLTQAVIYWLGALLLAFLAFAGVQLRRYFTRLAAERVARLDMEVSQLKENMLVSIHETDFARLDELNRIREHKLRVDFERNAKDAFLIKSLQFQGTRFFGDFTWELRPGVNILLGRNGYGKSLLLRSLAGLLQRNEESSKEVFATHTEAAFLRAAVERNGKLESIQRDIHRFNESPGKIPILAIPDSRFVNRTDTALTDVRAQQGTTMFDLRADGAKHFFEALPYGAVMQQLFTELCFDYLEQRSFDQPVFALLCNAINDLTGDRLRFDSVERVGRDSFRLMILTEGNERPLPIQYASQGTLSVIGVIGLIRAYLQALFPQTRDAELLQKPAIVLIDELDAHLHPLWQQKLTGLLRKSFPNVQFVLSAHSPLVVAGCWTDEAVVLRRDPVKGLVIQPTGRDFLGASVEEIYKVIFGVEAIDDAYLQSASRASSGFSHQQRISELESKATLDELERRELPRLIREQNMVTRAAELQVERKDEEARIMQLEAQVEALQDELDSRRPS